MPEAAASRAPATATNGETIMSDRHLHRDSGYLRAIAPRDPLTANLYARSLRNAYFRASASTFLRFAWRHTKQRFKALRQSTGGESYRLTSATKALITNLMAMR